MERFFDILLSLVAIICLLPIFFIVIVILRFSGEGEIFYFQERTGQGGKTFQLIKFVTMLKNSPNIGAGIVTIKDDPRVLPIGKFLRKSKINELPQLFNILMGHMSIIGPRPLIPKTFQQYDHDTQRAISEVKPGLSGVGSIIFRHEELLMKGSNASITFYNDVIAPYKGLLEEWYVNNKGIYIYFLLILITIWAVLFPQTRIAWLAFKDLPEPPEQLKSVLNY